MNWKRIFEIARWEYLQKVRSKAFIASLLITPLIMVISFTLQKALIDQEQESTLTIGVIDSTGSVYAPLSAYLRAHDTLANGQPGYLAANYLSAGMTTAQAIARADSFALLGRIEGTVVIGDSAGHIRATYRSTNPGNIRLIGKVGTAIETVVRQGRLAAAGVDTALYNRVSEPIDLAPVKVSEKGEGASSEFGAIYFTGYFLNILLMILVMTTGQSLVRSLVEEKSNRIMELLVSSITPQELMWGKLIGLSGLGLTQLGVWIVFGGAAVTYFAASPEVMGTISGVLPLLPYLIAYIILGYIFYAAIFVGIGSLVTTEQEAQAITSYLVLLLVIPTLLAIGVLQNPNAGYVRGLSMIPLLTPSMMIFRIITKMPPAWEVVASMGIMVASIVVVTWISSKIFRTAILLYGKRPNLSEVMRWLRA